MRSLLRIFLYARRRIIFLSQQNKYLKLQISALVEAQKHKKQ